ncbi:gamma-aminobutyric acid receptor subunit rho-3 [Notolabrus celidotus]|uniref:gamma-aminobutyric acid receptor subunit rho-3 n=1 Tax=Notolabrus celidotus TaxID=1203425 RepID=UPI00148F5AA2|nr:gamma-aminobutyric acid receptor subunit rho-3 [Notolabrus celidotus]
MSFTHRLALLLLCCCCIHTTNGRFLLCQFAWEMERARTECHTQLQQETPDSTGCHGEWDNVSCWQSAAVGEVMTLPCPSPIVRLFGKNGLISRNCTERGWSDVYPIITAACWPDDTDEPSESPSLSLSLCTDAYNENDLMLYWKNGNDSLRTDEIVLSQFFIEHFHASSGLAFYSSTGWYNRLFINFILRRHIFFFMLQTYFPTMLMVVLSWVSFWIDRRAVPARVSLGITTVLTMSTIITGVSSSMPQVSYVKAVDIYLWTSFLFVFLSVIEYAAVNYCTTLEEMRKMKRGKIPSTYNASQAMAFDGCFHDNDMELTPFPRMAPTLTSDPLTSPPQSPDIRPMEGTRLRRQRSVRENVDLLVSNSYMIDSYSRLAFPLSYLLFNVIYWSLYS